MNLRQPNASESTGTFNRSRSVVPMSGLCSSCHDGCKGGCEVWLASFRGREVLYPRLFGDVTAGADKNYPIDYSHLNIQGYAVGADGLPEGVEANPDTTIFSNVNTECQYGKGTPVKMTIPIFTGALGSTEIARKHWEHFAIGAAISGVTIVCGENVCGIDPGLELNSDNKIVKSPEMDRRIAAYRRFHNGYGDMVVQMNVEDTRLGVAEYIIDKHGMDTIELKWGQGAKCIGGEIQVDTIERALELKNRGYNVFPDPTQHDVQMAYQDGAITEFERHSRLGFVTFDGFMQEVERLRGLGFRRISLKTGAYGAVELAMALRYSAEAGLDLVTVDGAPGGTGMSPWPMMNEWGVPSIYLHALTYEFCQKLEAKGLKVPDIAVAGGFSTEDGVFKALAMGSPYVKAVCMGRALMIPGMVGANIAKWLEEGNLPKNVLRHGNQVEEIFISYETLKDMFGDDIDDIPLGAMGIFTFAQKFKTGLQQLMAGSRNFNLSVISRQDLMALTEDAAKVTGIPYVMDAYRQEAEDILNGSL